MRWKRALIWQPSLWWATSTGMYVGRTAVPFQLSQSFHRKIRISTFSWTLQSKMQKIYSRFWQSWSCISKRKKCMLSTLCHAPNVLKSWNMQAHSKVLTCVREKKNWGLNKSIWTCTPDRGLMTDQFSRTMSFAWSAMKKGPSANCYWKRIKYVSAQYWTDFISILVH